MSKSELLNRAIELANNYHRGQFDKGGEPYILHPLRVMQKFNTEDERIVAILHDVIEDSNITIETLTHYIKVNDSVVEAIDCLTKRKGESYDIYIKRILNNNLARKIKIEDIKDNLNLNRLKEIKSDDLKRIEKYHKALKLLEGE